MQGGSNRTSPGSGPTLTFSLWYKRLCAHRRLKPQQACFVLGMAFFICPLPHVTDPSFLVSWTCRPNAPLWINLILLLYFDSGMRLVDLLSSIDEPLLTLHINHRTSARKPDDGLLADFRQKFPEVSTGVTEPTAPAVSHATTAVFNPVIDAPAQER